MTGQLVDQETDQNHMDVTLENSKLTHIIDSCQGSDIGYPSDIQLCTYVSYLLRSIADSYNIWYSKQTKIQISNQ